MSAQQALTEFEPDALAVALQEFSAHSFHARQIYQWIYKRGVTDFSQMTDLSQNLPVLYVPTDQTWIFV